MFCPFCRCEETQVIDSRLHENGDIVRRRRRCLTCDKRFTTHERYEHLFPKIVKKNGARQEFNRKKMLFSMNLALRKRPVSTFQVNAAIERIEKRMLSLREREVLSNVIGEWVMDELNRLDKVAYIRFASVYHDFETAKDFYNITSEIDQISSRENK